MMVVPVPSPVAHPVMMIKRIGHANIHAQTSHMRACAGTGRSRAGSGADAADLGAGADLGVCGASEQNDDCEYRSGQRLHFRIPRWKDVSHHK